MMTMVSLNVRGLGGPSKNIRLCQMFSEINPSIVFLQETLCNRIVAIETILSIHSSWHAGGMDAVGWAGGMLATWDPLLYSLNAYKFFGGIFLYGNIRGVSELRDIDSKIAQIYMGMMIAPPDSLSYGTLEKLEPCKLEILKIQETIWKLKSRVQWLQEGDLNTRFIHNCANRRRNMNSIWRIKVADGSMKHKT